jgi:ribonuclease-3
LAGLERLLGHDFGDDTLLASALTHKSFVNEHAELARSDNERLEFLGDAVLGLVIGHLLMDRFPRLREGELSMMRAQIVSEAGLNVIARQLDLGRWLFLGRGEEQTGGRDKPSLLADAVEAIVAAAYLDGGLEAARCVAMRLFAEQIESVEISASVDFKTRLQERAQAIYKEPPSYIVVAESGPDHDKTFQVAVSVQGQELARAAGKSKKEAEQRAAAEALAGLGADEPV